MRIRAIVGCKRGIFGVCAGRGGFTLLEVLAALMLVAIVLPVVMRGISLSTQMASTMRMRDTAAMLAEAKVSEMVAERLWQSGSGGGEFDESWGDQVKGFEWRLEVANWTEASMREITVRVLWERHDEEKSFELTTLVPVEAS